MSRIGSSHPSVVFQIARLIATAMCLAGLVGCGGTIVTRIHSRDVVLSLPPFKRENQAKRLEKQLKILPHQAGRLASICGGSGTVGWRGRRATEARS